MDGKRDLKTPKTLNAYSDYVLQGQSAPMWEKPGYVNNSGVTGTARRLSQHMVFNPDNYRENAELDLNNQKKILKSISSSTSPISSQQNYLRSYSSETGQSKYEVTFGGKAKSYRKSEWYMDPVHLSTLKMSPEGAKHDRIPGKLGSILAMHSPEHHSFTKVVTAEELENYPLTRHDFFALRYFPITLGSSVDKTTGEVMPPSFMKRKMIADSPYVQESSPDNSNFVDESFDPTKRVESLYLMSQEVPTIASAPGSISTPFDNDLALLRMERLRIEEDRLLEYKRIAELERIRGPKPKWYELKNPEFHYESHKNTEMMKCEKDWDNLMHYREMLIRASKEYRAQSKPVLCY